MMLGRQRALVDEERVDGGMVDEGNERVRDGSRTAGRRKRAEEGLSEEAREQGSKGWKLLGRYPEEGTGRYIIYIHKLPHNAALAIVTLLLQMKHSEQVYIIKSVYCLSGG